MLTVLTWLNQTFLRIHNSPRVDFGAAIVPVDEYSSDEEEDNEIIYMEHQSELENAKPQPDGVDAPPTLLLDAE